MKGCGRQVGAFECCTVVQGDCLKLIRQLPIGSVDLCATDPPYGIGYQSNMRTRSDKFEKLANDANDSRFKMYHHVWRTLAVNSVVVSFCSFKNYAVDYLELQKWYAVRNAIIWNKGGGGIGDLKYSLATDYEMAIVAHKGHCKLRGKRDGSVWTVGKINPNAMEHATEKPVALFEKIIAKFSDPGALVLDPYCGGGSCLIAARRLGRHFLGFELDAGYCRIATRRIERVEPMPQMQTKGSKSFEYFDVLR